MKEEKVLMMAAQSAEQGDDAGVSNVITAIRNVLQDCIVTQDILIEELPSFDIEWLFVKVREQSVGSTIKVGLTHPHTDEFKCDDPTEVTVDLTKVVFEKPEGFKDYFDLGGGFGVKMTYPTAAIMDKLVVTEQSNAVEVMFEIVAACVEQMVHGDEVYDATEYDVKSIVDWLMNFSRSKIEEINELFFGKMPSLKSDVEWTCKVCKQKQTTHVRGIMDFFV
jgi:hypothetical protein